METHKGAYLEIILGSMFSGKTSRLVEIYKQCAFCDISVVAINSALDTRYDEELLSTHDKVKIPCIRTHNLADIWDETKCQYVGDCVASSRKIHEYAEVLRDTVASARVVLINEGQFFPDLYIVVESMLRCGKQVYVCGLDGDFERKKFGQMLDLIPLCDKVYKLKSLCSLCRDGTRGIFSKRICADTQQTVVGSDNYLPVCRACYEA